MKLKQILIRATRNLAVSMLLLTLAACQAKTATDGNKVNPDGMVTITHLNVGINGATPAATPAATRTANSGIKTAFQQGDVLHISVALTAEDMMGNRTQLSTATLAADGRWTLSPAITLPQNAADVFSIQVLYDGKSTPYTSYTPQGRPDFYAEDNYVKASLEITAHVNTGEGDWPNYEPSLAPPLEDEHGNGYFNDGLICLGGKFLESTGGVINSGSMKIATDGTLTLDMIHAGALIRIISVENKIGSPVVLAELITDGSSEASSFTLPIPDDGALPWQTLLGAATDSYTPIGFNITLADGRQLRIPLPVAITKDSGEDGFLPNCVYSYRLSLLPGVFTATLDNSIDGVEWDIKADPAIPAGYTAIRTQADLKAINNKMNGKYILMNDIDLTPADPAKSWLPLGYADDATTEDNCAQFTGHFNGNGHTLHGLTIKSDKQRVGLFAMLNKAVVYNLHFSQATVEGTTLVDGGSSYGIGTLVGVADNNSIIGLCSATDCTVKYSGTSGASSTTLAIGALVGSSQGSSYDTPTALTQCYATRCTVSGGNADGAGGLVGINTQNVIIASCYTRSCTVTGGKYAGGLVGYNNGGNNVLYGCYCASTSVAGAGQASGALVGYNFGKAGSSSNELINIVASCYATSTLKLIGLNGTSAGNTSGNARIIACVSPLVSGDEANVSNVVSLTPRGTDAGYLPLIELAQLASQQNTGLGFTSDGTLQNVPTAKITSDGKITSTPTVWSAASIWNTLNELSKTIPPMVKWAK